MQAHNNLVERTYRLEERTELQEEKIKVVNHRMEALVGFHKGGVAGLMFGLPRGWGWLPAWRWECSTEAERGASAPNSEEKIWSYLKDKGLADAGAAGLMRRHDPHLRRGGPINFGRK